MEQGCSHAFAKIHYQQTNSLKYAGCGFHITDNYLLTCTHVLTAASGNVLLQEGMEFTVDFPFISVEKIKVVLVKYFEKKDANPSFEELQDMALLKFKDDKKPEKLPVTAPIKFPESDKQTGHDFEIYSTKAVTFLDGKCKGAVETGWLVLNTDLNVERGDSGSPVWNETIKGITGMLVARQLGIHACYIIPTVKIKQAFSDFPSIALLDNPEQRFSSSFLIDVEEFRKEVLKELIMSFTLAEELRNAFLKQHRLSTNTSPEDLGAKLLKEAEQDVCRIIRNLSIVLRDSLPNYERKNDFMTAEELIKATEFIVISLALLAIENAKQLHASLIQQSITLPNTTMFGAETISAHRMQCLPNYIIDDTSVYGKNAVADFRCPLERGIQDVEEYIIEDISMQLWNKVFPTAPRASFDLKRLRRQIDRELKSDDRKKKNYYLVVSICQEDRKNSPLASPEIRQKLSQAIPELPIIVLDNAHHSAAFLSSDEDLQAEIFNFYQVMDGYENRKKSKISAENINGYCRT